MLEINPCFFVGREYNPNCPAQETLPDFLAVWERYKNCCYLFDIFIHSLCIACSLFVVSIPFRVSEIKTIRKIIAERIFIGNEGAVWTSTRRMDSAQLRVL